MTVAQQAPGIPAAELESWLDVADLVIVVSERGVMYVEEKPEKVSESSGEDPPEPRGVAPWQ